LAIVIPVAAAILQGTVAPLVAIGGVRPSLPILVAAAWSVAAGAREAVWWAFVGGIASDLLSGGPLGASACASLPPVAALGVARLFRRVRRPDRAFVHARRFVAVGLGIVLVFAGLTARLYDLQIVRGAYYRDLAEQNRILRLPVRAERGSITDRTGRSLVMNI